MTVAEAVDQEERGRGRRYDAVVGAGRCGGRTGRARPGRVPGGAPGHGRGRAGGVSVVSDALGVAEGVGEDPPAGSAVADAGPAAVAQASLALPPSGVPTGVVHRVNPAAAA